MLNKRVEKRIKKKSKLREFITPDYEGYCFSNIPSIIMSFFRIKTKRQILPQQLYKDEIEGSDKFVLILIDGFGYTQWLKYYRNYELFNSFTRKGLVSPLTSVFPSTTAAAMNTINSGLTPQEHALPEWNVYFKEIDMIIETIPFRALGDDKRDTLIEEGANPEILFKGKTIYQSLNKRKINSFKFVKRDYAYSAYSKLLSNGSKLLPFENYSNLVIQLRKELEEQKSPAYFYVYIDDLDSVAHDYGPHSDEYLAELSIISKFLKKELVEKIKKKIAKETTIIITADHGQLNVSPEKTIYLNKIRKLVNNFRKSKSMGRVAPTGSPRDVFLHIKQNKVEETIDLLSERLKEKAKIMKTKEAIDLGLFGIGKIRKEFVDRVGNLLVLPYDNNLVWYEHIKGKKVEFLGHHGGLNRNEVLIPFAIAKLSDLI